jgi:hypothetical protein
VISTLRDVDTNLQLLSAFRRHGYDLPDRGRRATTAPTTRPT